MAAQLNFDCTPKCSSRKHIYQLISAITKTSEPIIINFISRCYNASKSNDMFGRTLLHAAASCGNKTVVDWLMQQSYLKISPKDLESGWTPLHRAIFHGHLDIALYLIQNGSDINIKDREFLTPFELILKDRPKHIDYINTGLNDVYGWGTNVNSTLGLENMQSAKIPEQIDFFRREKISIIMVSMNTFHTIFLSGTGHVYVCGHGQDGRLGLGSEKTILSPTLVNTLKNERCVQISAGLNQSYFLMESGSIYSCGLNTYNQLLHNQYEEKSLVPKLMYLKNLKIMKIEKIFGLKYHTIIMADNNLYTWGLNAGQIGHGKLTSNGVLTVPRLVNQIMKGVTLTHVATCDYVTSFVTSRGDLYVMQDYLCRKVIHRLLGLSQICVSGGKLDPSFDPDKIKHSSPITLVALTTLGKMLVWNSDENLIRHIHWNQQRPIKILNFCLGFNWLVAVTTEGDCFTCVLSSEFSVRPFSVCAPIKDMVIDFHGKSLSDLVSEMEFLNLSLQKIPTLYRANYVACDPKGPNVIILQASPNASLISVPIESASVFHEELRELLLQSDEYDSTYDVILKFNSESFYCHKFILSQKSTFFQNHFTKKYINISNIEENIEDEKNCEIFKLITNIPVNKLNDFTIDHKIEAYQINCKNIATIIFEQFLIYLYTGICDFISPGINLVKYCEVKKENIFKEADIKSKKKKGKPSSDKFKIVNMFIEAANHFKFLAKFFEATNLLKLIDKFDYSNSYIQLKNSAPNFTPKLILNTSADWAKSLSDITIETHHGSFECHKCVLVARMDYFKGMLSCNWAQSAAEGSHMSTINIPIDGKVFENIVEYLYTDDCKKINGCQDIEFLCKLLSAADQFLLRRMQEIIEVILSQLITLKNVCDLLEVSIMCNALQLTETCMQFIIYNLAECFEIRILDSLSEDVLKELSLYYQENTKGMNFRIITPYAEWPFLSDIQNIEKMTTPSKSKRIKTKSETINPIIIEDNLEQSIKEPENQNIDLNHDSTNILTEYNDEIKVDYINKPLIKENKWTPIKTKINKKNSKINDLNFNKSTNMRPVKNDHKNVLPILNIEKSYHNQNILTKVDNIENKLNNNETNSKSNNNIYSNFQEIKDKISLSNLQNPIVSYINLADDFPILEEANCKNLISVTTIKEVNMQSPNLFKPKKKESQKKRKNQQRHIILNGNEDEKNFISNNNLANNLLEDKIYDCMTPVLKDQSLSSSVWGQTSKVIESFKELMINEISNQNDDSLFTEQNNIIKSPVWKKDFNDFNSDQFKISGGDSLKSPRWQGGVDEIKSPNTSLQKIMEEETQLKEYLIRRRKTNLQHVLLEEKALDELLDHYKAKANYNEFITVERVVAMNMVPLWAVNNK